MCRINFSKPTPPRAKLRAEKERKNSIRTFDVFLHAESSCKHHRTFSLAKYLSASFLGRFCSNDINLPRRRSSIVGSSAKTPSQDSLQRHGIFAKRCSLMARDSSGRKEVGWRVGSRSVGLRCKIQPEDNRTQRTSPESLSPGSRAKNLWRRAAFKSHPLDEIEPRVTSHVPFPFSVRRETFETKVETRGWPIALQRRK